MLIQWCLKGIPESAQFGDAEARGFLSGGMPSMWMIQNAGLPLSNGIPAAQRALGDSALDDHVNNYWAVSNRTPYISLSAGAVVPMSSFGGVSVRPAWRTALDFATRGGQTAGFVFRCWTIVSPKPCASLLNVSDEVRDLNLFRQFWLFHDEGEIAAKLIIPCSQIEWAQKFDDQLNQVDFIGNPDFIDPNRICNLVEAVA